MREWGIFNDEGMLEGGFVSQVEAQLVLERDYAEDDAHVAEECRDHAEHEAETCEPCIRGR